VKSNDMFCGSAGIRVWHLGCSGIESEHRITQRMYLWRYSGALKHQSMGTTDWSTGIGIRAQGLGPEHRDWDWSRLGGWDMSDRVLQCCWLGLEFCRGP
jgi:hypothetical protein